MATQFPERVHYHSGGGGDTGVFGYIVVGLLILAIIVFVIVVAVRVSKMRREEAMKNSGQFPPEPRTSRRSSRVSRRSRGFAAPQPGSRRRQGFAAGLPAAARVSAATGVPSPILRSRASRRPA